MWNPSRMFPEHLTLVLSMCLSLPEMMSVGHEKLPAGWDVRLLETFMCFVYSYISPQVGKQSAMPFIPKQARHFSPLNRINRNVTWQDLFPPSLMQRVSNQWDWPSSIPLWKYSESRSQIKMTDKTCWQQMLIKYVCLLIIKDSSTHSISCIKLQCSRVYSIV